MRNSIGLTLAMAMAVALAVAAPSATVHADPAPYVEVAEAGTGSAAIDSGASAAQSALLFAQRGDLIGLVVLLGVTPIYIVTSGICDLATMSALPNPCSPTRY